MIKRNLKKILSFNGISILIGIVGGIFGIISIFIDWKTQVSIKWFALMWITYSFILLISVKLTYEIYQSFKTKISKNNKVIQFSNSELLLLVENNNNLEFSQYVSIYFSRNNFELLLANGYVQNVQEKFVQIKILEFYNDFIIPHKSEYESILNNDKTALEKILIKNYLSYNG